MLKYIVSVSVRAVGETGEQCIASADKELYCDASIPDICDDLQTIISHELIQFKWKCQYMVETAIASTVAFAQMLSKEKESIENNG